MPRGNNFYAYQHMSSNLLLHCKVYNKGLISATVDIVQNNGFGSLLAGLGPTIIGYSIEGAMKFGVYEVTKPIMIKFLGALFENVNIASAFLLSSVIAGAVAAILLCPMVSFFLYLIICLPSPIRFFSGKCSYSRCYRS